LSQRIEAIDLGRGVAVTLMILSHGVNGLLAFEQIPDWGMVPIHLVTKFASSLFILVFGIAMAVAYLPRVQSPDWPQRRLKLLLTALVIFFWYKLLTIFEMLHLYEPEHIVDALLFRAFPVYVEILGFYAIALLWLPFFLPLWRRMPLLLRLVSPVILGLFSYLLARHFHFWGLEPLEAILVEHPGHYTWGQLARGPLILVGLLIGEWVSHSYRDWNRRLILVGVLAGAGLLMLVAYVVLAAPDIHDQLMAVARNVGKHPPELHFMLFSVGGALVILALVLLGGEGLAKGLFPITIIGSDALKAFIFHIFVIFVGLRFLLQLWQDLTYGQALALTILLIMATPVWITLTRWVQAKRA